MELLTGAARQSVAAVVLVTHDPRVAAYADRQIAATGPLGVSCALVRVTRGDVQDRHHGLDRSEQVGVAVTDEREIFEAGEVAFAAGGEAPSDFSCWCGDVASAATSSSTAGTGSRVCRLREVIDAAWARMSSTP